MNDTMDNKPKIRGHVFVISGGLSVGLFMIALGTIWLLDTQGYIRARDYYGYFWSAVMIIVGLEVLGSGKEKGFGAFLFGLGLLKLAGDLGYIPFRLGAKTIWPLLIIMVGLLILFNRTRGAGAIGMKRLGSVHDALLNATRRESDSNETFQHAAILGGVEQQVTTKNFKGGRVTAILGGIELDLRDADIAGESAELEVAAVLGGAEIRIPNTWALEVRANAFLGGISDETRMAPTQTPSTAKRLIVKGAVVLGGLEFKN